MSNYSRWLLITSFLSICSLYGCAHKAKPDQYGDCNIGGQCTLEGKLSLNPGAPAWAALLEVGQDCVKLALPDSFYSDAKSWEGKRVRVVGRAFQQPEMVVDGNVMFWFSEKERKLALGMCDGGLGIYVESMESRNRKKWPAGK